jgi:hypothetical protein
VGEALRRAALLAILGGAVAALALTASPPERARHVPLDTHDELPVFVESGSGTYSVSIGYDVGDEGAGRLADTLTVFRQQGALQDLLPSTLQQLTQLMSVPGYELEGSRARLLVTSGAQRVYGVPMRNGSVCLFRETWGGLTCTPSLLHGAYPQVEPARRSRRGYVWGLADNGAASVRVHLATGWLTAKLGRNGFYLDLPRGAVAPSRIVVREQTGARHLYDVKRCRPDLTFLLFAGPVGPLPC